jgi:hypothetical protein
MAAIVSAVTVTVTAVLGTVALRRARTGVTQGGAR